LRIVNRASFAAVAAVKGVTESWTSWVDSQAERDSVTALHTDGNDRHPLLT
jgi:hypothetical protein